MGDTYESASALNRPRPRGTAERSAGNGRAFGTKLCLAPVLGDGVRPRRVRSKPACFVASATYFHRAPPLIGTAGADVAPPLRSPHGKVGCKSACKAIVVFSLALRAFVHPTRGTPAPPGATPLPSPAPPPARSSQLLLSLRPRQALPAFSHCRRCRAG